MYYGYFKDGEIVAPVQMCPRFDDIGAWHTLSDEQRALYGWHPCRLIDEQKDLRLHIKVEVSKTFSDSEFIVEYAYIEKDRYQVVTDRLQYLKTQYEELLQTPVQVGERFYTVAQRPDIESSIQRVEGYVYLLTDEVVRLTATEANNVVDELNKFENNLLTGRYLAQEAIKAAPSPEEVLAVDISVLVNKQTE